ncbi:NUDIX domain-containing protein [archaeon]|jgi:8-oxo-dGTP pyrophosphatase MutT (NUDIX family)|nr:NUDIX domain-containing protein [archaeon]MBT7128461.1 NUDIX domain-containing protein [archaeon]
MDIPISQKISQIKETHKMIKEIKEFPNLEKSKPTSDKTHQIAVTGIIRNKEGKYLICKRSPNEKAFPNKWCVPGGKIETKDFINTPKDTQDHWFDIFEKTLMREVLEETSLTIKNIGYISNLAFIHPNGSSSMIVSLHADHDSGIVKLQEEELTDHAWVTIEEAKEFNLIENILEQIIATNDKLTPRNS